MSVDIRRIQKTGASTMTVSLPKDWIDSQGLKAGDPVGMQMMPDGTVNVDPRSDRKKEPTRKTIRIEKEESEEHLTRKLIGAYLAGFNIIEVRSKDRIDHDIKHAIKDFARLVIGPEVIEETSNSVVLARPFVSGRASAGKMCPTHALDRQFDAQGRHGSF